MCSKIACLKATAFKDFIDFQVYVRPNKQETKALIKKEVARGVLKGDIQHPLGIKQFT
jgi:hypothetical protein